MIREALDEMEKATCFKFVERKWEHDYVEVNRLSGACWSEYGRKGGRQRLNLGVGCMFKVVWRAAARE